MHAGHAPGADPDDHPAVTGAGLNDSSCRMTSERVRMSRDSSSSAIGRVAADRAAVRLPCGVRCRALRTSGGSASAADGAITAPMPGKVIALDVAEGDSVTAGQRLMVLEAMKMEHALTAPFDGIVAELAASEGAQVQVEAVLAVVEPAGT